MKYAFILFAFLAFFNGFTLAEALDVHSIQIKGLKRIPKNSVLSKISLKKGSSYSVKKVTQDVKALFATDFFFDIKVSREDHSLGGVVLVYQFEEKPMISAFLFKGNHHFEDSELLEKLPIKNLRLFNAFEILSFQKEMEKMYEEAGYFLVDVFYKLEQTTSDQINLVFYIDEGAKISVDEIQFIGNENITKARLTEILETRENKGLMSTLFGGSAYKKEALQRDVQRMQYFYYNEGYVRAQIQEPQVFVSQDKSSLSLIFKVKEGKKFFLKSFNFKNHAFLSKSELTELVNIKPGDVYSYGKMVQTLFKIKARYGDFGYAFCNVIPIEKIKGNKVHVDFEIQIGKKFKFGNFNVIGNDNTRDYVVLRELRMEEGALYNDKEKTRSQKSVKQLGFFDEVNFINRVSKTNPEEVDIDIALKERKNTGVLSLGGTYSPGAGVAFTGQVSENNFLGKGQVLNLTFNLSTQSDSIFDISFTEPYFLGSKYPLTTELARLSSSRSHLQESLYTKKSMRFALRSGFRISEFMRIRGGYSFGFISTTLPSSKEELKDIFDLNLANSNKSTMSVGFSYDTRNDRIQTTAGQYLSLGLSYTGLIGDLNYTKVNLNYRFYRRIWSDLVWRNNFSYKTLVGSQHSFDELFLLGGPFDLRGFNFLSLGNTRLSEGYRDKLIRDGKTPEEATLRATIPFGGSQQIYLNTELQFPLFKEINFYGSVFYDIGRVGNDFSLDGLKSNFGFEVLMWLPIGPMRFGWGFPLGTGKNDPSSTFYILINPPF